MKKQNEGEERVVKLEAGTFGDALLVGIPMFFVFFFFESYVPAKWVIGTLVLGGLLFQGTRVLIALRKYNQSKRYLAEAQRVWNLRRTGEPSDNFSLEVKSPTGVGYVD